MTARLRDLPGDGYPTDYLIARLQARRAALVQSEAALRQGRLGGDTSDELIWSVFIAELAWLRGQMNRTLRERCGPLFVLFELKTVVLGVRSGLAERYDEVERLLAHSQLDDTIRDALGQRHDAGATIAAVAAAWSADPLETSALQQAYAAAGLKGFEQQLTRGVLESLELSRLDPTLRRFFRAFVDVRNLVTLYKHLRWNAGDAREFIGGGGLDPGELKRVSEQRDSAALDGLVRRIAGRHAPPVGIEEPALESILLGVLTQLVRAMARAGAATAVVLDHAWASYVHARNRALVLHAGSTGTGFLLRELIA